MVKKPALILLTVVFWLMASSKVSASEPNVRPIFDLALHAEIKMSKFKRRDLRNIFTLKRSVWPNGTPIQVVVLKSESTLHQQFVEAKLGLLPYQVNRIWKQQIFAGAGLRPIEVESWQELLSVVSETPGAIGYIKKDALKETINENITIIDLDN